MPSTSVASPTVHVRPTTATAAAWDGFAQDCHASFRCGHRGTRAWQAEWPHRLHRLDLFAAGPDGERKVGQCAVGVGRRRRTFADGVQLLPDHAALWPPAVAAVLDHLGPGTYQYGSEWSLEPPRQDGLAGVPGVAVTGVRPTDVDVIDFARWPTLAAYRRAVSENVRRNVKRATAAHPGAVVVDGPGWIGARRYLRAVALRRAMYRRKGVRRSTAGMVARSVARGLGTGPFARSAYLVDGGTLLASYGGVDFGPLACYLEGASRPDNQGASWALLMAIIERAYDRTGGTGRFVMGSDDGTQAGTPAWEGLRRSRRQCCANPVPTSVVRFTYAAGRR